MDTRALRAVLALSILAFVVAGSVHSVHHLDDSQTRDCPVAHAAGYPTAVAGDVIVLDRSPSAVAEVSTPPISVVVAAPLGLVPGRAPPAPLSV